MNKPTPEEKLFAVIQGAPHPSPRARAHALSLATVGGRLKAFIGAVDLPRANQALTVAVALLGVVCLVNPFVMRPRVDRVTQRAAQHLAPFIIAPPLEGLQSADEYLQVVRAQDPFRLGDARPVGPAVQAPPAPMPPPPELLSDLRLVGIAWGPEPRVMIEQISQNMTHVLKVGDPIGAFTVKAILQDRAVLQMGEQEIELF